MGIIFGLAGSIVITVLNQKAEERKHVRQLTFSGGIENWKEAVRVALTQEKAEIPPFEFFIMNSLFLSELMDKKRIDKERMKEFLTKKYKIMEELYEIQGELESEKRKSKDKEVT